MTYDLAPDIVELAPCRETDVHAHPPLRETSFRTDAWLPAETDRLLVLFGADEPLDAIADALGRGRAGVTARIQLLGLRRHSTRPWSELEDADLCARYGAVATAEIASALGRRHPDAAPERQAARSGFAGARGVVSGRMRPHRLDSRPVGCARPRRGAALLGALVALTAAAPVTAIIGMDLAFYEKLPQLVPHNPDARSWFESQPEAIQATAFRNSSLQGGYFILAARALGLDCGPMSGFDNAKVDAAFFAGTDWRSNFLVNLGYGDPTGLFDRSPRLSFDEACRLE